MLAQCVIILTAGHFWLNTFVEAMNENKPGTHMLFEMWAWIFQTHSQPIRTDLKGGPSSPETQKRKRPAAGEKKKAVSREWERHGDKQNPQANSHLPSSF